MLKKIFGLVIIALVCSLGFSSDACAKTQNKAKKGKKRARVHQALAVSGVEQQKYAAIVVDARSGRILFEENASEIRYPASLTKMMTLYLAFQAIENGVIRLETPLPVSQEAAAQSPTKLGLRAGQTVRAYDAIMGLITESANDAAVVLAEALGGSKEKFAEMMVAQARALGMRQTVFRNPNGLPDPEQVTSARDMAALGHGLIYHYPGFYPYFSHNSFTYKGRVHNNHNNLMKRYDGMDGIKTGYIRLSGFNLVASAVRGETRLIGVIFGGRSAASRDKQMEKMLDDAFELAEQPAGGQQRVLPAPSKVSAVFGRGRRDYAQGQQTLRPANQPKPQIVAESVEDDGEEKTAEAGSGEWGIQVGAYSDVSGAQQALGSMARTMAPLLGQAEQSIQKVTVADGSAMYRARFMGLEQKTARDACSYMVKHGQSCLVVSGP